ncbi:hypothetical protein QL285_032828 [Trifolium repens]|jgi:hypothetical protein|nr:hypothetical protein QL285_032828 [Trifolium repens]
MRQILKTVTAKSLNSRRKPNSFNTNSYIEKLLPEKCETIRSSGSTVKTSQLGVHPEVSDSSSIALNTPLVVEVIHEAIPRGSGPTQSSSTTVIVSTRWLFFVLLTI